MDTPRRWLVIARPLLVTATIVAALSSCEGLEWVEGICKDDEVTVRHTEKGGGYCRARTQSDPDCPEGEIPQESRPGREIDCVPNDISEQD